jgi:hypothetical protein
MHEITVYHIFLTYGKSYFTNFFEEGTKMKIPSKINLYRDLNLKSDEHAKILFIPAWTGFSRQLKIMWATTNETSILAKKT